MEEIWKVIEEYPNYMVSNLGRVKSLNYNGTGREGIMKPYKNKYGYLYIWLCKNGVRKSFRVHRLVAQAFIPNPNNLPEINHKDENCINNFVDNLEWCTQEYNHDYGTHNERVAAAKRGKKHSEAAKKKMSDAHRGKKLSDEAKAKIGAAAQKNNIKKSKAVQALDPKTLEVIYEFPSTREAQRQGFNAGAICNCCNGKLKYHKGFIWRYKISVV